MDIVVEGEEGEGEGYREVRSDSSLSHATSLSLFLALFLSLCGGGGERRVFVYEPSAASRQPPGYESSRYITLSMCPTSPVFLGTLMPLGAQREKERERQAEIKRRRNMHGCCNIIYNFPLHPPFTRAVLYWERKGVLCFHDLALSIRIFTYSIFQPFIHVCILIHPPTHYSCLDQIVTKAKLTLLHVIETPIAVSVYRTGPTGIGCAVISSAYLVHCLDIYLPECLSINLQ